MSARHHLDLTVQRLTGHDIRLLGNWEPPPDWGDYAAEIASSLGIPDRELERCRDIADVLAVIPSRREASSDGEQLGLF